MDHATPKIVVLLATYNGARYLNEQLESLRRQSWSNWQLAVRDDGSSDETPRLLRAAARQDRRITLLDDRQGRLGLLGNFGALMQWAVDQGADYAFFADQDDVWRPDKLALQMDAMQQAEAAAPPAMPILLHTDMNVVDAELRTMHPSFMAYQGIQHEPSAPLNTLLAQNFVTGCTMLLNRALLELATPLPSSAAVHDWWIALCAAAAGRIEYLPTATLDYRQHAANAVGAKGYRSLAYWRKKLSGESLRGFQAAFRRTVAQASAVAQRLRERGVATAGSEAIERYCALFNGRHSARHRLQQVRRLGIHRQRLAMHAAYLAGVGITRRLDLAAWPPSMPTPHIDLSEAARETTARRRPGSS